MTYNNKSNVPEAQLPNAGTGDTRTYTTSRVEEKILNQRIRKVFHELDRLSMFMAGLSVAYAVHFFAHSSVIGLLITVLVSVGLINLSNFCNRASRRGRYHV